MTAIIFSFIVAFGICYMLVPMWIKSCTKWNLYEKGGERKHHVRQIPSMGGLAIFAAMSVSFLTFADCSNHPEIKFLIASSTALFFTGFFDDLLDINALKKLFIQIIAACIVVANGININAAETLFGATTISTSLNFFMSVFVILFITNAFNFIDGLDGLASFKGLLITSVFGMMFILNNQYAYATLSFAIAGALLAFLFFNFEPAKVFMGDSGSLVVGFSVSILAIQMFNISMHLSSEAFYASPNLITATLFVLIFDLSRVSFIRIANGGSPFKADRSHIHHMIARHQFGHRGTTFIMISYNVLFIILALLFPATPFVTFLIVCYALAIFLINNKVAGIIANARNKFVGTPKLEVN
jgi:UDP-N-acetylmuramyl pentapeptide phosphotransferase/UDP-N-acetylglucosamine-1-phosphate transferase